MMPLQTNGTNNTDKENIMAMPPKKPTIAGPRPTVERKYVATAKAKKAAAAFMPVKITGTASSSYEKKLVTNKSLVKPAAKFVENKPKSTKKLTVNPSKKINK
jgi:hypothetical protein